MTPEEALNFIYKVAEQAAVPKQVHAQAQQAYEMLKKEINPEETK